MHHRSQRDHAAHRQQRRARGGQRGALGERNRAHGRVGRVERRGIVGAVRTHADRVDGERLGRAHRVGRPEPAARCAQRERRERRTSRVGVHHHAHDAVRDDLRELAVRERVHHERLRPIALDRERPVKLPARSAARHRIARESGGVGCQTRRVERIGDHVRVHGADRLRLREVERTAVRADRHLQVNRVAAVERIGPAHVGRPAPHEEAIAGRAAMRIVGIVSKPAAQLVGTAVKRDERPGFVRHTIVSGGI